jgi:rRNA maturation protein Nop10
MSIHTAGSSWIGRRIQVPIVRLFDRRVVLHRELHVARSFCKRYRGILPLSAPSTSRMCTLGIVRAAITRTFAGLAGYVLRAERAGRCSQCGGSLVGDTPTRWCVSGHKIHQACVKYAMEREICPICGIYVSESPRM